MIVSKELIEGAISVMEEYYRWHAGINFIYLDDNRRPTREILDWLDANCLHGYSITDDIYPDVKFNNQGDMALYKLRWFGAD